jgi:hypothetical protein
VRGRTYARSRSRGCGKAENSSTVFRLFHQPALDNPDSR